MKKNTFMTIGRFALLFAGLWLAFSCSKQEVENDTIGGAETETAGDADAELDDYISPDNFNMIEMDFGADANEEEGEKSGLSFSMIEDNLDDEDESTRTALDASGNITWNEGDGIKVYYYKGTSNYTEATIKHGGEASSTLTARVNDSDKFYYAFYPYEGFTTTVTYEGDATYAYGALQVTIPSTQTVTLTEGTDNNFASCHMAVGKASKEQQSFVFSNVGSYMKLQVTNTTATAITLQSSNGENIVGTFTVPFTNDAGTIGTPVVDSGSSSVRVILPERSGAITVYVPLLPNVSVQGFRVRYEYSDGNVHPGYANAKLDAGVRVARTFARRHVLNVGNMDNRIRENYYVKTDGTCSDADVTGAGNAWSNALNLTGFVDLLAQKVDGDGNQITLDDHDRAWMLDGSTIHLASGSYALPATGTSEGFKVEFSNYSRQVKINLLGAYNAGTATRDTTTYATTLSPAATGYCAMVFGNQTDVTIDKFTFSGAVVDQAGKAALKFAAGDSGNTSFYVSSCIFTDNSDDGHPSAACVAYKSTGQFFKCTFSGNSANEGAAFALADKSNGGDVNLTKCKITGNSGAARGGAIALYGSGRTLTMTDCIVSGNHAVRGGCVLVGHGTLSLSQCGFYGNYTEPTANNYGGGAIYMVNNGSALTAENCHFKGNYCKDDYQQWGGVLYVEQNTINVAFTNCLFDGNYTSHQAGVIYMYGKTFLKLNGCIFINNHSLERGIITGSANINLMYLNRVTFKDNYTTSTGTGWGININAGAGTVCMNNVTSLDNYNSDTSGTHVAFNSDGNWLITNSTIIDSASKGLVRSGAGSDYTTTVFNNILINTMAAGQTWRFGGSSTKNNRGYNVLSSDNQTVNNMPTGSYEIYNKSKSDVFTTYSAQYSWKEGNYFNIWGVCYMDNDQFAALGFTSPVVGDLTNTLGSYFELDLSSTYSGITNVGYNFFEWLDGMKTDVFPRGYNVDGRYLSRDKRAWYPGSFQRN